RAQATLLSLAAIDLILHAVFHHAAPESGAAREEALGVAISLVLLTAYALGLIFSLRTHHHYFDGGHHEPPSGATWSVRRSLLVLCAATAMVAWISEILVATVEHAGHALGMTRVFVGVIVVAIIGNAAEHSTAILVAMKNRMDLSLGIAIGSSIQVALFVAPVLVLLSHVIAPAPMDLLFTLPEVVGVALAVAVTGQVVGDGESNWLEGVLLLAVYVILAIAFYFLPETAAAH
ncbi:MAG: calcium/proton exchanger, partial [Candidatus Eiseniibacteriota bacterium]